MISLLFLAAASGQPSPLTKLIEHCDPIAVSHGGCGNLVKPVWRRFESETGEITKVDMASITPTTRSGVTAMIYTYLPGSTLDLTRLRTLYFTCRGQFADLQNLSYLQDAPPRSVIGFIAATVCPVGNIKRRAILANNARVEQQERERAIHPRPQDYCQGFSTVECSRIQAGVEAGAKPSFCVPGFGLVGSGLTPEQLRICYARSPIDN